MNTFIRQKITERQAGRERKRTHRNHKTKTTYELTYNSKLSLTNAIADDFLIKN